MCNGKHGLQAAGDGMMRSPLATVPRILDKVLDRLSRNCYPLAQRYYRAKLRRQDRTSRESPVLVYQMGKVGSSSVVKSLRTAGVTRRIYHVHFLTQKRIEQYEERRRHYLKTRRIGDLRHIWQYKHLRERLAREPRDERWKVITLVRDPVARNLATFFEHIEVASESSTSWDLISAEYEFEITVDKRDLDPLIELFFEKCRHDSPLIFFDREFDDVLGIDIFDRPFPTSQGYEIYHTDRFDILLLRIEDLNRVAGQAFDEFLDLDAFTIVNTNVGRDKDYADVYDRFKRVVRLPAEYLDMMYSSKYSTHFYTQDEIDTFRARWLR